MPLKEFILTEPRVIQWRDYEERPLNPDEVRIRTLVSGIKHGTELNLYRGTTPFLHKKFDLEYRLFMPEENQDFYPCYLGSWAAGEVIETGAEVTEFTVGQLVHGSMDHRQTNIRKAARIFPIRDGVEPEKMLFTDPAIFALASVHDAQIKVGDRIAVFGMGALGLLAVQIARLNGAEAVFAVDMIDERLELARKFGADMVFNPRDCDPAYEIKKHTGRKGADAAIDISGAYAGLKGAVRCVHQGGLVVAASYYNGMAELEFGAEWHHNRPTLISSMPVWGNSLRCHPMWDLRRIERTAMHLIEDGRVVVDEMMTQHFAYEDAIDAYRFIDENPESAVKTGLRYD